MAGTTRRGFVDVVVVVPFHVHSGDLDPHAVGNGVTGPAQPTCTQLGLSVSGTTPPTGSEGRDAATSLTGFCGCSGPDGSAEGGGAGTSIVADDAAEDDAVVSDDAVDEAVELPHAARATTSAPQAAITRLPTGMRAVIAITST
jgi:hypothetical protein